MTILLLDVMSTLVSEPFFEEVPKFLGLSLEEIRARRDHQAYLDFECGKIGEREFARRFFIDGSGIDGEGMKSTIRRSVRLLPGVDSALSRLRARSVPMYALSNYSEWYRVIDESTGLSRYIDWSFVSCKTGVRKPDPEAYLKPVRTLGVEPKDCLFVDDRPANVEAAEAVGMRTVLRLPETDLGRAFEERGLLPKE